MKEIGKTPLINHEQEKELARRIKAGDVQAIEELTKANLRFVVSVAKQYQNQGIPLPDLINEGNTGLITAVKRFDETRGFKFISYAVWWIRQAILAALAEQSRIVNIPLNRVGTMMKIGRIAGELEQSLGRPPSPGEIASELNLGHLEVVDTMKIKNSHLSIDAPMPFAEDKNLIENLEDKQQPSPEDLLLEQSLRKEISAALDSLTPREAEVLLLYFGLNGERAQTLEEIGRGYNLTRERVRQIKEIAIRRLRKTSRVNALRAYLK